jgi:hypothetical protein
MVLVVYIATIALHAEQQTKRAVTNPDAFRYLTTVNKSQGPVELGHCNVVTVTGRRGSLIARLGLEGSCKNLSDYSSS